MDPLQQKELTSVQIKGQTFSHLDLKHKVFTEVVFEKCDFTHTNFTGSRFLLCKMIQCNLSLARLDGCRLQGVEFEETKIVGVNFTKCDPLFLSLQFTKCLLNSCNFSDMELKGTSFYQCAVCDTFFTNANLMEANFAKADLSGSIFHNTNLTKANFREAVSYSINPLTNKLSKAIFSRPEVLSLLQHLDIVLE
jgi:fluoroquinolone resistance protein